MLGEGGGVGEHQSVEGDHAERVAGATQCLYVRTRCVQILKTSSAFFSPPASKNVANLAFLAESVFYVVTFARARARARANARVTCRVVPSQHTTNLGLRA